MSRQVLRQKPRISYFEPKEHRFDEYFYCEQCYGFVFEYCSIHGPLLIIPDDKYEAASVSEFVCKAVVCDLGAGLGVFATLTIPRGVRFGPYLGKITADINSKYCWQIYDGHNLPQYAVDAEDENNSNWMRYVNCARHWQEQNLIAFQYQGQLYYRTIKTIPRFTELMVFYGAEYANSLNVDLRAYNSPKTLAQIYGAPAIKKCKIGSEIQKPEQEKQSLKDNDKQNVKEHHEISINLTKTNGQYELEKQLNENNSTNIKHNYFVEDRKRNNNNVVEITLTTHSESNIKNDENSSATKKSGNTAKSATTNKNIDQIQNTSFNCDSCKFQSIIKKHLENHMRFHDENRAYQCEVCGYRYEKSDLLNKHKKYVHKLGTSLLTHKCNVCEFTTCNKSNLKRHLLSHSGAKPYACDMCNYKCAGTNRLTIHKRTHTGEKPYACDMCTYKCTETKTLTIHKRTHTGEKPYACDMCDYKCTGSYRLKTHKMTHTGEKPYACDMCDYKCTESNRLKIHKMTHTGDKPYACDMCNSKFSRLFTLNSHKKVHM